MSDEAKRIFEAAMRLPDAERAALASVLKDSVGDGSSLEEIEAAWIAEAERALASYWSPRLELAGTYDQRWAANKWPLLPDDYDPAHLLSAPADQRPRVRLRGGELVELINMSPAGHLRLELPRIELRATTRIARRHEEHGFELATVVIEPEDARLIMVWHGSLLVRAPEVDELHYTEIREVAA